MNAMQKMTEGMIKENQPKFEVGDTVRVSVRIKEGDKERIQAFEGTVIAKKHGGIAETFTVRRTSYGVGVERVFPVNMQQKGRTVGVLPFLFYQFLCRARGLDWLWQVPL